MSEIGAKVAHGIVRVGTIAMNRKRNDLRRAALAENIAKHADASRERVALAADMDMIDVDSELVSPREFASALLQAEGYRLDRDQSGEHAWRASRAARITQGVVAGTKALSRAYSEQGRYDAERGVVQYNAGKMARFQPRGQHRNHAEHRLLGRSHGRRRAPTAWRRGIHRLPAAAWLSRRRQSPPRARRRRHAAPPAWRRHLTRMHLGARLVSGRDVVLGGIAERGNRLADRYPRVDLRSSGQRRATTDKNANQQARLEQQLAHVQAYALQANAAPWLSTALIGVRPPESPPTAGWYTRASAAWRLPAALVRLVVNPHSPRWHDTVHPRALQSTALLTRDARAFSKAHAAHYSKSTRRAVGRHRVRKHRVVRAIMLVRKLDRYLPTKTRLVMHGLKVAGQLLPGSVDRGAVRDAMQFIARVHQDRIQPGINAAWTNPELLPSRREWTNPPAWAARLSAVPQTENPGLRQVLADSIKNPRKTAQEVVQRAKRRLSHAVPAA